MIQRKNLRMRSFEMISNRISDPKSLRSLCIKGIGESTQSKDSLVSLVHSDMSDLGSLILFRIIT